MPSPRDQDPRTDFESNLRHDLDSRQHVPASGASGPVGAAAPASTSTAKDDATLTTRCLLQYCAQWPQHRDWVKGVLAQDGFNLEYVGAPFRSDKEIVSAAVSSCGAALQFAAQQLKSDRDVVTKAVQSDPFALGFASDSLRADAGVVLAALRRDPAALALADAKLFACADFMLAAIKLDATAATYATSALLADPEFRLKAKAANSFVLSWFANTEHFPGLQDPAGQQEFLKNSEQQELHEPQQQQPSPQQQ